MGTTAKRIATASTPAPVSSKSSTPPEVALTNGAIEAVKWLAVVLMTLDHVNKYLLHDAYPGLFAIGRLAMPLFAFTLAYNLARPATLEGGAYSRVLKRLATIGAVSSVPFIALGGLGWGWWPLNIMAMLFVASSIMWLWERGGKWDAAAAVAVFLAGGAFVEFWWPGVALCVAAWRYFKRPSWTALAVCVLSVASLYVINRNLWALAAFPVFFLASKVNPRVPRLRSTFYAYYPAHLAVLWALSHFLAKI
ncbi:TraX family protein [Aquabacterium sp. CECT 9606]|uniref:TraX family protein n=1 Tax=Aquabacterium sp. CECT 9606 TaxID=2845822 RepID=UPI001EF9C67E|nr:TraX family protein [Aquabacterium sp. CECT 9606]CAH0356062.1 hypothetical protein AQB9606_04526 [Aquabacterium sp. CECT 9606]